MTAVTLSRGAVEFSGGTIKPAESSKRSGSIASQILAAHHRGGSDDALNLVFDSLTSHDITYVGIIQTARASGLEKFPVPYVLTNCHNSLCAVGGTINEDDHAFALSAAKKYGGIYVPPNLAVIHSYNRETMAGCGKMILGSDSHTRYGALGTMGVGEGGGELAKQLLGRSYDMPYPGVVAVYLHGEPKPGVGPQDVALSIIKGVFKNGYVKNKVMEFIGPGIASLSVDFRNGVDVMTTETTCWSSIWATDDKVKAYLSDHGRVDDFRELKTAPVAIYDGCVDVDLGAVEPCIALPFHPSNVYTIAELKANAADIFASVEKEAAGIFSKEAAASLNLRSKITPEGIRVDQGIIAGCSGGTFENVMAAAALLENADTGNGAFTLSVYPDSQAVYSDLVKNGAAAKLMAAGVILKPSFCGPCFGAGDTPANGQLSCRHTTRNFPNREGSKPVEGQLSAVALMDARSIAATAKRGGILTAATTGSVPPPLEFSDAIYKKRIFYGFGHPDGAASLVFGPNIKDWPAIPPLKDHLLVKMCAYIEDSVTTTDELIPSGETSSYRSNPLRLAEFTLSRKDPLYVSRAKAVREEDPLPFVRSISGTAAGEDFSSLDLRSVAFGSAIYARKPGDGSAREQAASCQRVLGGAANFAQEYATKRYRSNLLNWGILPFLVSEKDAASFALGDAIFIPRIREIILDKGCGTFKAYVTDGKKKAASITLGLGDMTDTEREILLKGCLINYYKEK